MAKKLKAKKPRGRQHDLRGAFLARLADDCKERIKEIQAEHDFATERILTLKDFAGIFRNAAKRERKLR